MNMEVNVDFNAKMFDGLYDILEELTEPFVGLDMSRVMREIRILCIAQHQQRFDQQKGLNGAQWAPDSLKSTVPMKGHDTILFWEGALIESMDAEIDLAENTLRLFSNSPYANTMQYGAKKGEFGAMGNERPIPWGDIPPRPWFGIDAPLAQNLITRLGEFVHKRIQEIIKKDAGK